MKMPTIFLRSIAKTEPRILSRFWIKCTLSILAVVSVSCCASQEHLSKISNPFEDEKIADIQTVADPTDLKQLIKSLPVWDCPPPHCPAEMIDAWIERNGELKGASLFIAGDGAQDQLRITRLSDDGFYEVEVGSKDWPEGGYHRYKLRRLADGWEVVSR